MFIFSVNDNLYAFDIESVQEVAELRQFVPIPKPLAYLRGAMNYKGTLYSIIDISSFFDRKESDTSKCDIILLSDRQYKVGFLADRIIGAIDNGDLKKTAGAKGDNDFIKGYFDHNGTDVKLINVNAVLNSIESGIDNSNFSRLPCFSGSNSP